MFVFNWPETLSLEHMMWFGEIVKEKLSGLGIPCLVIEVKTLKKDKYM